MLNWYLVCLNLCFVSVTLAYYFRWDLKSALKTSYAAVAISTILVLVFLFAGIGWQAALLSIVIFNAAYLIMFEFTRLGNHFGKFHQLKLKDLQKSFQNLKNEDDRTTLLNKQLDKRISEIAGLYEITKEMSATLQYLDIFEILTKFLRKNFLFRSCRLILINQKEPKNIDKVYQIRGVSISEKKRAYAPKPKALSIKPLDADLSLVKKMSEEKEIIKIGSFSNVLDREKGYIPGDIESFLAVPLLIEDVLIGILTIENLSPDDFDNFLILSHQFIPEMKKAQLYRKVQELAITDGLTGAYVRRHFFERLEEELKRSRRHNFKASFLMLDIDYFKACNDTYGHLVGDAVLNRIGDILRANVRQIDLVSRYGGEEFSILLPETNKTKALLVAERIRKAIAQDQFKVYDEFTNIHISIGVATFPDDAGNKEDLVEIADKALYRAKNEGRNRVCTF